MKLRIVLPIILFAIILSACGKRQVFLERHKFEKLKWNRFQNVYFEPIIVDTTIAYDITLSIRHHTQYPYPDLFMTLAVDGPTGEHHVRDFDIYLRNTDGSFKSKGNGDLWDFDYVLYKGYHFNGPGKYKFEFENRMPKFDTFGLMELSLIIEKSKQQD